MTRKSRTPPLFIVFILLVTSVFFLLIFTAHTNPPQVRPPTHHTLVAERIFKLTIIGWHEDLVTPLSGAAKALTKLGYNVTTTKVNELHWNHMYERLRDQDIVLWWAWGRPALGETIALRRKLHWQTWAVFNWDDPHTTHTDPDRMKDRAAVFDVVFTTGEASLPLYHSKGVAKVVFLPPPADLNVFYPDSKEEEYQCDVNFVLTNLYAQFDPKPSAVNRTGLILELARVAKEEGFKFHLYGPKHIDIIGDENYRGEIQYHNQRELFARCLISINTHVNDGFGGRYANERDVIVPASGGLLLVDSKTPSILEKDRDCVMMISDKPAEIAQQVVQILKNYDLYMPIKQQGYFTVRDKYSSDPWAVTVHSNLQAFLKERQEVESEK